MSNLISININIMDIKRRHMLICLYLSMLKANEKGEIALRTKDNYQEKIEIVKLEILLTLDLISSFNTSQKYHISKIPIYKS
jgi:hypothetical protein